MCKLICIVIISISIINVYKVAPIPIAPILPVLPIKLPNFLAWSFNDLLLKVGRYMMSTVHFVLFAPGSLCFFQSMLFFDGQLRVSVLKGTLVWTQPRICVWELVSQGVRKVVKLQSELGELVHPFTLVWFFFHPPNFLLLLSLKIDNSQRLNHFPINLITRFSLCILDCAHYHISILSVPAPFFPLHITAIPSRMIDNLCLPNNIDINLPNDQVMNSRDWQAWSVLLHRAIVQL